MNLQLKCHETVALISQAQDAALSRGDQVRLSLHLAMCRSCRNADEQLSFLRDAMRDDEMGAQPSGQVCRFHGG